MLICALAAIGFGAVVMSSYNAQRREAARYTFMQECVMDRKRYECAVLWSAANSRDGVAVLPVTVPMGR